MPKIIMTIGLPASGKSTWAKEQVAKSNGHITRVNKDDLRAMMHNGEFHGSRSENEVLNARDNIVGFALTKKKSVIVDDTNFHPKHEAALRQIAENCGAEFEIKDFTDVSVEECIKRDNARPNGVGRKVIMKMYNDYLKKPEVPLKEADPNLPWCIICDIDGTLANMGSRNPFDWKNVDKDTVHEHIADLVRVVRFSTEFKVLIVSGRDGCCADTTKGWLSANGIPFDEFYIRPEGDGRKDTIIKEEIYHNHIEKRYNVRFVLDDRDQVVKMWRGLGIPVLQVAEGNF